MCAPLVQQHRSQYKEIAGDGYIYKQAFAMRCNGTDFVNCTREMRVVHLGALSNTRNDGGGSAPARNPCHMPSCSIGRYRVGVGARQASYTRPAQQPNLVKDTWRAPQLDLDEGNGSEHAPIPLVPVQWCNLVVACTVSAARHAAAPRPEQLPHVL